MTQALRRLLVACAAVAALGLAAAPAAMADAAGPTDYNTVITAIEPSNDSFEITMIGGDSFVGLEQQKPVEIIVLGYQAEQYLRFAPNGEVFENRRAPSTWLNQERYGNEDAPAFADAEAIPQWKLVADNGRYSWHDHRSHWMNPAKPPGAVPGDQILEATIPLVVDGERVTVTVESYLLDSPSWWPIVLGVMGALGLGITIMRSHSRLIRMLVGAAVALWATAFGWIAYGSVPVETQPSRLLWLLPLIAALALLLAAAVRNRLATTVYLDGLAVAAGAALVAWALHPRQGALRRSLIPSDAPAGLEPIRHHGVADHRWRTCCAWSFWVASPQTIDRGMT